MPSAVTEAPARPRTPPRAAHRPAVAAWAVSRALVVGVWLVAATVHPRHGDGTGPAGALLGWDATWYARIAADGYEEQSGLRFFPLLPLLARAAGALLPGGTTVGLFLVANAAALAYLALLAELTRRETGDRAAGGRAAWFAALAPGAAVLALPYTEALAGALAVGMFLALRGRRPLLAAGCGVLSGLARPTGVLLVVPAVVELFRPLPRGRRQWALRGLAAASPLFGTAGYLLWCAATYGRPLLPYSVQTSADLRGAWLANPVAGLLRGGEGGLDWRPTLLLVGTACALAVVVARRLPGSYLAWTLAMLGAAVTSSHGHSLPRYLAATFPLLVAAALVTRSRLAFGVGLAGAAAGSATLAALGFTSSYVP